MPSNPRVDAYIAKAPDFAQPILTHIRAVVRATCPDVEETIKWGFPVFMYHGMLCNMAAFKQHATFGFWKGALVMGAAKETDAMGQYGKLTTLKDLPPRSVMTRQIKEAMRLNRDGISKPRPQRATRPPAKVPPDLSAALAKNRKARTNFDAFSPGKRREYIEWITEAKTDATRSRRLATAIEWIAEGKARNWKYEKC